VDFEKSLKPIWNDLVRFSRSLTGSRAAGDDLLQEALLRAWRSRLQLRSADSFRPWLFTIIHKTHLSMTRLRWIKRLARLEEAEEIVSETGMHFVEREVVRSALQTLPLVQREAIILFEVLDYPAAQIAVIQKTSLSAVKSRLARGREKLLKAYLRLSETPAHLERASDSASVNPKQGEEEIA